MPVCCNPKASSELQRKGDYTLPNATSGGQQPCLQGLVYNLAVGPVLVPFGKQRFVPTFSANPHSCKDVCWRYSEYHKGNHSRATKGLLGT